jgi:hypothetical protein
MSLSLLHLLHCFSCRLSNFPHSLLHLVSSVITTTIISVIEDVGDKVAGFVILKLCYNICSYKKIMEKIIEITLSVVVL